MTAIGGEWEEATLRGRLVDSGWGVSLGYPGLVLDEDGDDIEGFLFVSPDLKSHWAKLDAFEGEQYERVQAVATRRGGERVEAFVYGLRKG